MTDVLSAYVEKLWEKAASSLEDRPWRSSAGSFGTSGERIASANDRYADLFAGLSDSEGDDDIDDIDISHEEKLPLSGANLKRQSSLRRRRRFAAEPEKENHESSASSRRRSRRRRPFSTSSAHIRTPSPTKDPRQIERSPDAHAEPHELSDSRPLSPLDVSARVRVQSARRRRFQRPWKPAAEETRPEGQGAVSAMKDHESAAHTTAPCGHTEKLQHSRRRSYHRFRARKFDKLAESSNTAASDKTTSQLSHHSLRSAEVQPRAKTLLQGRKEKRANKRRVGTRDASQVMEALERERKLLNEAKANLHEEQKLRKAVSEYRSRVQSRTSSRQASAVTSRMTSRRPSRASSPPGHDLPRSQSMPAPSPHHPRATKDMAGEGRHAKIDAAKEDAANSVADADRAAVSDRKEERRGHIIHGETFHRIVPSKGATHTPESHVQKPDADVNDAVFRDALSQDDGKGVIVPSHEDVDVPAVEGDGSSSGIHDHHTSTGTSTSTQGRSIAVIHVPSMPPLQLEPPLARPPLRANTAPPNSQDELVVEEDTTADTASVSETHPTEKDSAVQFAVSRRPPSPLEEKGTSNEANAHRQKRIEFFKRQQELQNRVYGQKQRDQQKQKQYPQKQKQYPQKQTQKQQVRQLQAGSSNVPGNSGSEQQRQRELKRIESFHSIHADRAQQPETASVLPTSTEANSQLHASQPLKLSLATSSARVSELLSGVYSDDEEEQTTADDAIIINSNGNGSDTNKSGHEGGNVVSRFTDEGHEDSQDKDHNTSVTSDTHPQTVNASIAETHTSSSSSSSSSSPSPSSSQATFAQNQGMTPKPPAQQRRPLPSNAYVFSKAYRGRMGRALHASAAAFDKTEKEIFDRVIPKDVVDPRRSSPHTSHRQPRTSNDRGVGVDIAGMMLDPRVRTARK